MRGLLFFLFGGLCRVYANLCVFELWVGRLFPCVLALLQNLNELAPTLEDVYFSPQTMLLLSSGVQVHYLLSFVTFRVVGWVAGRGDKGDTLPVSLHIGCIHWTVCVYLVPQHC